ncbi:hypothetical protein FRACYDRAFT_240569 [Fragilariopsis cylindrus CCMP1102]|uniref:BAG domain-containing protein n=1 Tax=Fragilariopsis cylindrus CCMP1102 TaxID=635003 RepID=A0A1E7FDI4_9STRA|nr:hypothetical protein FRACYDRAFT_240569 [Fragilariopsis cylindrus CCMP1102]|eukprot:OEU15873.1 hypothetical protein FRACYDRAFT_240569 [Fragilariopsis cylindrus CCMP1102]
METFKAIGEKLKNATNGGFVVDTDEIKKNIDDIIVNPLSTKLNETVAYANNEINATTKKWQSSTTSSSSKKSQSDGDTTAATITITLRITGLGHNMTLKDLSSTTMTMAELMTKIYNSTGIIPRYQRLIGPRGLKIDSNNDNSNDNGNGGDEKTLFEIGIKDRTKLILMHSPLYSNEKDSYEKLIGIEKEINDLKNSILIRESISNNNNNDHKKPIVVSEMVTRICCKLDLVDTVGSIFIRLKRKELIKKVEGLETIR